MSFDSFLNNQYLNKWDERMLAYARYFKGNHHSKPGRNAPATKIGDEGKTQKPVRPSGAFFLKHTPMEVLTKTHKGVQLTDEVINKIIMDLKDEHCMRYGVKHDETGHKLGPARKTYPLDDLFEDLKFVLKHLFIK